MENNDCRLLAACCLLFSQFERAIVSLGVDNFRINQICSRHDGRERGDSIVSDKYVADSLLYLREKCLRPGELVKRDNVVCN